jgi:hypothetical protein
MEVTGFRSSIPIGREAKAVSVTKIRCLAGDQWSENGGAKIDHGSGGDVPSAGGVKLSHL